MSEPAPEDEGFVVRVRGLPWTATPQDVTDFFKGLDVAGGENGIKFLYSREGRPSGEVFVEFTNDDDVELAVKKHKEHMGSRYLEVFKSRKSEMDWVVKRSGTNQTQHSTDAILRLRGLPFGCSKEEIAQFFTGMEIVPNGIMLPEDRQGRSTGEAYVQFASQDIAEKALNKHMERIGHRYIEIFKSTPQEAYAAVGQPRFRTMGMNRPGPYDRNDRYNNMGMGNMGGGMGGGGMGGGGGMAGGGMGGMGNYGRGRGRNVKGYYDDDYDDFGGGYASGFGGNRRGKMNSPQRGRFQQQSGSQRRGLLPGSTHPSATGHSVHMRGLPFQALDADICEFFSPQKPVRIEFEFFQNGRPTGEANVDFATHQEALEAMKCHKKNMQHRYIELFCNSTPGGLEGNNVRGFSGDMGGNPGNQGGGFAGGNMGGGNMGGGGSGGGGGYTNNTGNNMGGYNSGNYQGGNGGNMGYMGGGGAGGGGGGGGGYNNMGGGGMNNSLMGNPNYTAF